MSLMIDNSKLETAIVNKCIVLYKGVIEERSEIDVESTVQDIDYGVMPLYVLIRMYDAVRKTEHFYKRTFVKAWMYKDGAIDSGKQEESIEDDMIRSGMFYKRATGDFCWDLERMKAFINMTYGPGYARGYSFDIRIKEDDIYLENEEVIWVS